MHNRLDAYGVTYDGRGKFDSTEGRNLSGISGASTIKQAKSKQVEGCEHNTDKHQNNNHSSNSGISFPRVWCMPNRYTFELTPVAKLLSEECDGKDWIDPMCGPNSPASHRNDINEGVCLIKEEGRLEIANMDAKEYLKRQPDNWYAGCLFDPPYSAAMMFGKYASQAVYTKYILDCKDEIARIVKPGGKVICFGWNSNGLGKSRGFELTRGLLLAHGGSHQHDTIVTVEVKQ